MSAERILMKGNDAIVHGAIAAGLDAYFGYPITPQNEIPELMSSLMPENNKAFVQAESEVAAINMVLGAAATGKKAMTSSSGPGVALMQEAISYMAGSELPGVFVNQSRGGPGLGDIYTSQGDYFQSTRGGGHGDYRTIVLAPSSCQESYEFIQLAFALAFRYRNPVMILGDAMVGQTKEPVKLVQIDPYKADDLKAETWALSGTKDHAQRKINSLHLDEGALGKHNVHLNDKYIAMQKEAMAELYNTEDAELIVVAFGSIGRIARSTISKLKAQGKSVGLLRPQTLYPFPHIALQKLAREGKRFLVIEQNFGQMVEDVRLSVASNGSKVDWYGVLPGLFISADDLIEPIGKYL